MLVRLFRAVCPVIVLLCMVGVYATEVLYLNSSVARAVGLSVIGGALVTICGLVFAGLSFGGERTDVQDKLQMTIILCGLIASFGVVVGAFKMDWFFGVAALGAFAFTSLACSDSSPMRMSEWYLPGQILNIGLAAFVFQPNMVGVASVILCVLVYAPLADPELLHKLKERKDTGKKTSVDKVA